jgi:hypothetical protein
MSRVLAAFLLCLSAFVALAHSQAALGKATQGRSAFPQKSLLRFEAHGIAFNYPPSMQISIEQDLEVTTIMIEGESSLPIMIQVYPNSEDPVRVHKLLLKTFVHEYLSRKAELLQRSGKTVKRRISGNQREGQVLKLLFLNRSMNIEVYAFQRNKDVVAVVLQYVSKESRRAEKYFSPILESLE